VVTLLDALPAVDASALHALGDALGGPADDTALAAFADAVRDWLWARLDEEPRDLCRLARAAEVWEKINDAVRDADIHNLDRKPLVFAVFGLLAETAR
jgi:DNA polymerase-3 subunit delta'